MLLLEKDLGSKYILSLHVVEVTRIVIDFSAQWGDQWKINNDNSKKMCI